MAHSQHSRRMKPTFGAADCMSPASDGHSLAQKPRGPQRSVSLSSSGVDGCVVGSPSKSRSPPTGNDFSAAACDGRCEGRGAIASCCAIFDASTVSEELIDRSCEARSSSSSFASALCSATLLSAGGCISTWCSALSVAMFCTQSAKQTPFC